MKIKHKYRRYLTLAAFAALYFLMKRYEDTMRDIFACVGSISVFSYIALWGSEKDKDEK